MERDEGFAHPGEIRGFRHVLSWKENLFQHIGFGNSCMKTDVRSGKHQKMFASEQKPFSSAPFFLHVELKTKTQNKVFFTTLGDVLGFCDEFELKGVQKQFGRKLLRPPQLLALRQEATTRDNRKVKEPTNTLVLCARKSCLTGPRFSECDCFF